MSMEKMKQSIGIKIAQGVAMTLFISALMYVITYDGNLSFGEDIKNEYLLYFDHRKVGWGLFSAIIGEALMFIGSSKAPAVAILIILIFLSFMFLTGFTLIKIFQELKTPAMKAAEKISETKQNILFDFDNVDEETGEVPRKKRKSHLFVYNDEDLVSEPDEKEPPVITEEPEIEDIPFDIPVKTEPVQVQEPEEKKETEEIKDIFALAAEKQAAEEEKKLSKSEIDSAKESVATEIENAEQTNEDEEENYVLPPLDCLRMPVKSTRTASQADLKATADKLIDALNSFNVSASVIDVVPGPSVT